jgi:drug/metabolite transporter (DMT)-like permease
VDPLALALVLVAAGAHAGWNLLAKQARGGVAFVWMNSVTTVALWWPAALVDAALQGGLSWAGAGFMAGSGALHAGYFAALQRAYSTGDLSVVYPLARGTGPALSVAAAVVVLGERPDAVALAGGLLIVAAVLVLATPPAGARRSAGTGAAALTGVFIAAYTVWDAHAVTDLHQPPVAYLWGLTSCEVLLMAPFAQRDRAAISASRREDRRPILGVAVLSPLAYVLVLWALTRAPVALVAPAREASVVVGAVLGVQVLGEGHAVRRVLAATAIAAGIVALAVG